MNGPGTGKKHLDYSETKHKYSFHEVNEFNSTSKKYEWVYLDPPKISLCRWSHRMAAFKVNIRSAQRKS